MKSNLLPLVAALFLVTSTTRCSTPATENAQSMQLGNTLILASPSLSDDAQGDAYAAYLQEEVVPAWNARQPDLELHAFRADRGGREGDFLLAWSGMRGRQGRAGEALIPADALDEAGLTSDQGTSFVSDPGSHTEYELVGADAAAPLPDVELLGIHQIKVNPEQTAEFEAFVRDTLYSAFEDRGPGMRLLYYKGLRGADPGDYILIFTFDTVDRREQYFPTGQPETEALTEVFRPMTPVADGLMRYQVEGTYLDRSSGLAAAVFESADWTDYVHLGAQ